MNGKTGLPVNRWKAERDKLTAKKNRLNMAYVSLKGEVREVEKIRRNVDNTLNIDGNRVIGKNKEPEI